MEGQDRLRGFYEVLRNNPSISGIPDDYNVFRSVLSDKSKAKGFYDSLKSSGNVSGLPNDFDVFSSGIGLGDTAFIKQEPEKNVKGVADYLLRDGVAKWDKPETDSNAFKLESLRDSMKNYPATFPSSLESLKQKVSVLDSDSKDFLDEWELKQKERDVINQDPAKALDYLNYTKQNYSKYKDIRAQRETLIKEIDTHPDKLSEQKLLTGAIHERLNNSKSIAGKLKEDFQDMPFSRKKFGDEGKSILTESDRFSVARDLYARANDVISAPSKHDESNGFANFMKGAGNTVGDKDFWTLGLTGIMRNSDVAGVVKKLQSNTSGDDVDKILSPGEQEILAAFTSLGLAQANRANDLSLGYMAGGGAAESLGFMAEFLATGGIAKAASKAATNAVSKWLIRQTASNGLMRELGKGLVWGTKAGIETAARTPLMPSTYKNITDRLVEPDENGNIGLKSGWEAVGMGVADSFVENLSELSGGHLAGVFGTAGKAAGKLLPNQVTDSFMKVANKLSSSKAGDMWRVMNRSDVSRFLKQTGYNGVLEEWGEEWYGALLRNATIEPDALKDYATIDNQLVTISSFLPMALVGGGVSAGMNMRNAGRYKKSVEHLEGMLSGVYTPEQLEYLKGRIDGADNRSVSQLLTPIVNEVASVSPARGMEMLKAVSDFMYARSMYHVSEGAYGERVNEMKAQADKRMTEETGGYVNGTTGNVDMVGSPDGRTGYIVGETGDGAHKMYMVNVGGEKVPVSHKDFFDDGGWSVAESLEKEAFLDRVVLEQEKVSEETLHPIVGGEAMLNGERVKVQRVENDGSVIIEKEGGKVERVDGGALNYDNPLSSVAGGENVTQTEIEEPIVPDVAQSKTPTEEANQVREVPVRKNGKPDYNAMLEADPEQFASEWEKRSSPESAKAKLEGLSGNLGNRIDALVQKSEKETDLNRVADLEDDIVALTQQKEKVDGVVQKRYGAAEIQSGGVSGQQSISDVEALQPIAGNNETPQNEGISSGIKGTNNPVEGISTSVKKKVMTPFQKEMTEQGEPVSAEEVIAFMIARGQKIKLDDTSGSRGFAAHLGMKPRSKEYNSFFNIRDEKQGMTPEVMAESVLANDQSGYFEGMDSMEVANLIIDILPHINSRRKALNYIKSNRQQSIDAEQAMAELLKHEAEIEEFRMAYEDWMEGMNIWAEEREKELEGIDLIELYTKFENESINKIEDGRENNENTGEGSEFDSAGKSRDNKEDDTAGIGRGIYPKGRGDASSSGQGEGHRVNGETGNVVPGENLVAEGEPGADRIGIKDNLPEGVNSETKTHEDLQKEFVHFRYLDGSIHFGEIVGREKGRILVKDDNGRTYRIHPDRIQAEDEVLISMAEQYDKENSVKNEQENLPGADNSVSLLRGNQNENEVSESISQGEYGTQANEVRGLQESANQLRRRIEEASRDASQREGERGGSEREKEINRMIESQAKEKGLWIPLSDLPDLGSPFLSGNENETYLDQENTTVYKMNNLMNNGNLPDLFRRIDLHNVSFPETKYKLVAFTGFGNGSAVYPIYKQRFISNTVFATPEEIDAYMRSLGFEQAGEASYSNGKVVISDLRPRNVLKDTDGDIYVIDADFKEISAIGDIHEPDGVLSEYGSEEEMQKDMGETGEGEALFRAPDNLEEINEQFNQQLHQQIDGGLPKGHIYRLGNPSNSLLRAGIPNLPIELVASKLELKSSSDYESNHPFELKDVENLPASIANPIAVFDSKTKFGYKIILTEISSKGNNFVVAMQINSHPKGYRNKIEINDIRSIYPKDNVRDVVNWINRGDLLRYVDKDKILNWVTQQRSNSAEVAIPNKDFDVVTNIVQSFENPTLLEGEISSSIDELSSELGVKVNKVKGRKELPDGITRRMKNGRYPGVYDPMTGEVYVVMNEVISVADAQATVLHEVLGHKGIRGLFGDKLPEFCDRVLASLPEGERVALVDKYEGNRQLAAEEYVASFAEGYVDPTAWEKVKAVVKEMLRSVGIDLQLSDVDLKYVLWKAKNGLKEGDGFLDAVDKVSRERKVGNELFRGKSGDGSLDAVNRKFNEDLGRLTEENASRIILSCGSPGDILLNAGIPNRRIALYGNKLLKKAKLHGYNISDVKDLPNFIQNPVALFRGSYDEGFAILTEMLINGKNALVSVDIRKGEVQDLNLITSVFDKNEKGIINWINDGKMLFVDKEKALNYLSSSAPIADATNNSELSSVTNIVKNFENPSVDNGVLFRNQPIGLSSSEEFIKCKRGKIGAAREKLVDMAHSVKELTDFLRSKGIKIRDFEDAYAESLLSESKSHHGIKRYQQNVQKPLNEAIVKVMQSSGKSFDDVCHYVTAKHAPERNGMIEEKNGTKDGSGMSDAEASGIVAEFENQCSKEDIDVLWERINAATRFALEVQYKNGFISKGLFDHLNGMFKYYVPLKGWEESDGVDYSQSERFSNHSSGKAKEAKGRKTKADNPFSYIEMAAEEAIQSGNRNYVRQCLYNMCVNNPDKSLYTVNKTYYVEKNGEWEATNERPEELLFTIGKAKTELVDTPHKELVKNTEAKRYDVDVWIGGEKRTITFAQGEKGLDVADAINREKVARPGRVSDAFGTVTRYIASVNTSKNPEFVLRNFERDFLYAVPAYAIKGGNSFKLMGNLPKAFKALNAEFVRGEAKKDTELNRYMDEYLNSGGKTGFVHSLDIESRKRNAQREINRMMGSGMAAGKARAVGKAMSTTMEYLSDMSENSIRFAVFITEREKGKGVKEAAIAAKEITVNFNRKGTLTPVLGSYFAFFNASIQGSMYNFLNLGIKWTNRFIAANAALGVIQILAASLSRCFGDDDELGVSDYDRLSDYTRNNNIILPDILRLGELFGWQNEEGRKYGFMTIPMPQSFRAVSSVGIIADQMVRGNKDVSKGMMEIVDNAIANMSPLDLEFYNFSAGSPSMFLARALPTAAQPFVDIIANKDFADRQVYKEEFMKNLEGKVPESSLGLSRTNDVFTSIAQMGNRMANGTTNLNPELRVADDGRVTRNKALGWLDWNPAVMEHIVEGLTGGRGRFWNNVYKTVEAGLTDKEVDNSDIPFVRTHRTMPYRKTHWEMYFDVRDQVSDVDFVAGVNKKARNYGPHIRVLANSNQLYNKVSFERINGFVTGYRTLANMAASPDVRDKFLDIADKSVLEWAKGLKKAEEDRNKTGK